MDTVLIIVLLLIGFLSFIPVISMKTTKEDSKYRCLKYLMIVTFGWTLLIFLERLSPNMTVTYFSHLLGYPVKFLLVSLMVCTIFNYIEIKMPKALIYLFMIIVVLEVIAALTNNFTLYFVKLEITELAHFSDLYDAEKGVLFLYHLLLSYASLLFSIVFLFIFLAKHKNVRQYKTVTRTMAISVVIVLVFNLLQVAVVDTNVDLTYLSLVVVSFGLYQAIYKKDMIFNLKTSGRGEILSNMREIYILTDAEHNVVEISSLLLQKYNVERIDFIGKNLEHLKVKLSESVVFYSDYRVDVDESPNKDHYHMREKKFVLNGMNEYGFMILLYDETQVFKLLRELNMLSNYDNMTGLNNRNFIETKLEKMMTKDNVGIVSLDLNGLKANNDYLGHERGDYLLKSLANKIKIVMSNYDNKYIGRIGGDEFLVILESTTMEVVKSIKQDILEECKNADIEIHISVSIGTAITNGKDSIYVAIQEADKDMYSMKQKTSKDYSKQIVEYAQKSGKYIR